MFDIGKAYEVLDRLDPRLRPVNEPAQADRGFTLDEALRKRQFKVEFLLSVMTNSPKNRMRGKAIEILNVIQDMRGISRRKKKDPQDSEETLANETENCDNVS